MTPRSNFIRKVGYVVAIAVLLMPLFWLSQPATSATKGAKGSSGGQLAQLREKCGMSQAQFGQIDPTSVTIKLATLGLRGVAADILWEKAQEYQTKKDYTNLAATLNQITKVQPNFVSVWIHQGWNMSYNVSAAFDNYRERYRWLIKGVNFLKEGIKYNDRAPRIRWELGQTLSYKIGKADESQQYRRLFKADDDYHGSLPPADRDNWLAGKEHFILAENLAREPGAGAVGKSPVIYMSNAPMCQMYYGEAIEKDGTFGEVAKRAWSQAADEWRQYGDKDIPTTERTADGQVVNLRLNDQEMHEETAKKLAEQIAALQPGLKEKIAAEKRAALTDKQREVLDIPSEKRSLKQQKLAKEAEEALVVPYDQIARRMKAPERREALKLAEQAHKQEDFATTIRRARSNVNFSYWKQHAEVEQTQDALTARSLLHEGDQAYAEGDLLAARDKYNEGMALWHKIFQANPDLLEATGTGDEMLDVVQHYRRILNQRDEPFPAKFVLQEILDTHGWRRAGDAEFANPNSPAAH